MSTVETHIDGAVGTITINRPDKRNAIDDATRDEIAAALAGFDADAAIRVLVIAGRGTAFCAGVDLGAAADAPPDPNRPRIVEPFERLSKPILAAINGVAVGGGLEIALACDMRIASLEARFALPEVKIGSLPGSGGTQRLPFAVGPALAAQMLFTGDFISAERALSAGLVSELCEPDALMVRAQELTQRIARNAPLSLIAAKRALRAALETTVGQGLKLERTLFNQLAHSEDRQEGRKAFRGRRPPDFKGK